MTDTKTAGAAQEIPFTCCGVDWHRSKVANADGTYQHICWCLICGKYRPTPEPPAVSEDERLALLIENAGNKAIGWDQHSNYENRERPKKWGLAALAKARELLAVEVESLTEAELRAVVQRCAADGIRSHFEVAEAAAEAQRKKLRPARKAEPVDALVNQPALDRDLDCLAKLPEKWDSYQGKPISLLAIGRARLLLQHLHISPLADGGVQLDMGDDFEVTINPDGTIAA